MLVSLPHLFEEVHLFENGVTVSLFGTLPSACLSLTTATKSPLWKGYTVFPANTQHLPGTPSQTTAGKMPLRKQPGVSQTWHWNGWNSFNGEKSHWIHLSEKLLRSLWTEATHQQPIMQIHTPCEKGDILNDLVVILSLGTSAAMWWV